MPTTPRSFGVGRLTVRILQREGPFVRHRSYEEPVERRCICNVAPGRFLTTDPTTRVRTATGDGRDGQPAARAPRGAGARRASRLPRRGLFLQGRANRLAPASRLLRGLGARPRRDGEPRRRAGSWLEHRLRAAVGGLRTRAATGPHRSTHRTTAGSLGAARPSFHVRGGAVPQTTRRADSPRHRQRSTPRVRVRQWPAAGPGSSVSSTSTTAHGRSGASPCIADPASSPRSSCC